MFHLLRFRILLAVAVILVAMGAVHHAMHMTQGLQGGLHDSPLASADFRAPIATLEARLFSPGPLTMEERIELAREFDAMRKALDAKGGTHLAKFSARELGTLAGLSRGLGELGGADLDRIRSNWMRVRSNTFDDASWYRFSEADPVAPAEDAGVVLGDADRATIAGLVTAFERIEQAIERGERDAERLGEPRTGAEMSEQQALEDSWNAWDESWRGELESIRGWLPAAPADEAPATVRFAHSGAARALDELGGVRGAGRAPYRQEWTRRFQNARKQVRDARFWIERAERGLGV